MPSLKKWQSVPTLKMLLPFVTFQLEMRKRNMSSSLYPDDRSSRSYYLEKK